MEVVTIQPYIKDSEIFKITRKCYETGGHVLFYEYNKYANKAFMLKRTRQLLSERVTPEYCISFFKKEYFPLALANASLLRSFPESFGSTFTYGVTRRDVKKMVRELKSMTDLEYFIEITHFKEHEQELNELDTEEDYKNFAYFETGGEYVFND